MNKKILFIYIGHEQGSWGSIAFPEKRHYYIMPGILYVCSALKSDSIINSSYDIEYRYFNRDTQKIDELKNEIESSAPSLIGFSTYCWNYEINTLLAEFYKSKFPQGKVIFGGPDITINNSQEYEGFFRKHEFADAAICGDSEAGIVPLVKHLCKETDDPSLLKSNTFLAPACKITPVFTENPVSAPDKVPEIIPFDQKSIRLTSDAGLAMVYETCRGCPYRCIYCKFGHKNRIPVHRDLKRIEREIRWLLFEEIECIHFADAVFDLDPEFAKKICRIILENNIRTSIFFYCSFLKLDAELAGLLEKVQAQIGVGIQSTDKSVIRSIKRNLSQSLFTEKRDLLVNSGMNFYTDLIFGLPGGNIHTFRKSINDVTSINPAFIMPFPLSIIRGTELCEQSRDYGIRLYTDQEISKLELMCDLEYRNLGLYRDFTLDDLVTFDNIAVTLFYFYNRFHCSISYILKRSELDPFSIYNITGEKTKAFLKSIGKKPSNTDYLIDNFENEIFDIFKSAAYTAEPEENELNAFKQLFKLDILRIVMLNALKRKKIFDNYLKYRNRQTADKENYEETDNLVLTAYVKTISIPFSYEELFSLSNIRDKIKPESEKIMVGASFKRWKTIIKKASSEDIFAIKNIPENRSISYRSLLKQFKRNFREYDDASARKKLSICLKELEKEDILLAFKNN